MPHCVAVPSTQLGFRDREVLRFPDKKHMYTSGLQGRATVSLPVLVASEIARAAYGL